MLYSNYIKLYSFLAVMIISGCGPAMPDSADVISREQQRVEYLASGNYDQLSDMLSPTMTYTHSNAILDNKEEFLQELRSGRVTYKNLEHQDVDVRFASPTVAIMNGITDVLVTVEGVDQDVPLRFTIVYVKEGGEWLFEAWHSVRRPE